MKKFVAAILLFSASASAAVVVSRPVSISRPVTVSRPITVARPAPAPVRPAPKVSSTTSNAALIASTAAVVIATTAASNAHSETNVSAATVSVADADADTRLAHVNIPLLTICSESQFAHAIQWQSECKVLSGNANLGIADTCSLLSYQRFCEPATVEDIKGKRPALPHYINTYMR